MPCQTTCGPPSGVCNPDTGACVQCTAADTSACTGPSPVCGADNICRVCTEHSECPSNVCRPDGACSSETAVAYVDPSGTPSGSCSKAIPCSKLQTALATKQPYIKVNGTINDNITINDQDVTIVAERGAKLTSPELGRLIEVRGRSQVSIFDLEITEGKGEDGNQGYGLFMESGNMATVNLQRVTLSRNEFGVVGFGGTLKITQSTINDNTSNGVSFRNGILNITRSTIHSNRGAGVSGGGGTLNVTRSTIRNNQHSGVYMDSPTTFYLTSNFIVGNGNNTSGIGGVRADPAGSSALEFNTIVDNNGGPSGTGGVFCDQPTFVYNNNLIYRNSSGTGGSCSSGNSFQGSENPGFVSATDYHLTASTPNTIRDNGQGTCSELDFDGDPRPLGAACDIGADEYKP